MANTRLALFAFGTALCAASAPALAGDGTNLTSMIAADTQMVAVFDVADSRDSTLLQKGYQQLLSATPDAKTKLAELGVDPMKDLDTVLFAAGGVADFDKFDDAKSFIIIVEGRLPKDKLAGMADAKKSKYQGVEIVAKDDTEAAFIGDRLFFTKKGKMKAAIDVALGKGKGKGNNLAASKKAQKMRDAIATADTAADLWIAVLIPDKNKKEMMAEQKMSADNVSISASFTADLAMGLRVTTDSEASAQKAVGMIQGQLAQVVQMAGSMGLTKAAKSMMVTADKAVIKMSMTITAAELQSVMNLAGVGGAAPASTPPPATPAPAGKSGLGTKKTP